MAEDSKQAVPSPEDRVRAMKAEELLQKIEAAAWVAGSHDEFDYGATYLRAELLSRLSLVGELKGQLATESVRVRRQCEAVRDLDAIAFGEAVRRAETAEREREELKGQVVSASPQPLPSVDELYRIGRSHCKVIADKKVAENRAGQPTNWEKELLIGVHEYLAQFFAAAPAAEARKRKDYHAEYVEAVEAAVKTQGELGVMREALQEIASYEDEIFAKQIALKALTPEPASQAAEEKR